MLVHPPGDVVRLLQRVGQAGHRAGRRPPGAAADGGRRRALEAAVTCASGRAGQCEPLTVADAPLDVLCQQVVGMCCARSVDPDEAFALVTQSAPFADLQRADFDAVLAYLRGLDGRGEAWLPARLREDGDCFRVKDARTARLVRRNLGTILSERTVAVRLRDTSPKERRGSSPPSDPAGTSPAALSLSPTWVWGRGGQGPSARSMRRSPSASSPATASSSTAACLEYRAREGGAAVVEEVPGRPRVPRWNAGGWPLSAQLAQRLFLLRLHAAEALRDGPAALQRHSGRTYGLTARPPRRWRRTSRSRRASARSPTRPRCWPNWCATTAGPSTTCTRR
ncbi:MAG: hypothetical protein U0797_13130 [Gemmataceae bacterium]